MRVRTTVAAVALAAMATVPVAGVAVAQERVCGDRAACDTGPRAVSGPAAPGAGDDSLPLLAAGLSGLAVGGALVAARRLVRPRRR